MRRWVDHASDAEPTVTTLADSTLHTATSKLTFRTRVRTRCLDPAEEQGMRFPCSGARRKTVLGLPCELSYASPGPGGGGTLAIPGPYRHRCMRVFLLAADHADTPAALIPILDELDDIGAGLFRVLTSTGERHLHVLQSQGRCRGTLRSPPERRGARTSRSPPGRLGPVVAVDEKKVDAFGSSRSHASDGLGNVRVASERHELCRSIANAGNTIRSIDRGMGLFGRSTVTNRASRVAARARRKMLPPCSVPISRTTLGRFAAARSRNARISDWICLGR